MPSPSNNDIDRVGQLESEANSELVFICGSHTFEVSKDHFIALGAGSAFLNELLQNHSSSTSTESVTITLNDIEPAIMARVINWMRDRVYDIVLNLHTVYRGLLDPYDPEATFDLDLQRKEFGFLELQQDVVAHFRYHWGFVCESGFDEEEEQVDELIRVIWDTTDETARGMREVILEHLLEYKASGLSNGEDACRYRDRVERAKARVPQLEGEIARSDLDSIINEETFSGACGHVQSGDWPLSRLRRPAQKVCNTPDHRDLCGCHSTRAWDVICQECGAFEVQKPTLAVWGPGTN